jgi:hypothetical protein
VEVLRAQTMRASGLLINGNEEVGFVGDGARAAAGFDFPVGGRIVAESGSALVGGEAELDGDVAAGEADNLGAVERLGVFVEFVADQFGFAVVATAGSDVLFLDTAKREG